MSIRSVVIAALLAAYLACDVLYARAWESRLTLAFHELHQAPEKPRVLNELGLSLMEARRFAEAQIVFDELARIMDDPRLPVWDRSEARKAWTTNRVLLARLTDAMRMPHR